MDPFQSGFCPAHGMETVLVALLGDLQRHLEWGSLALLILLDLSAALDTVNHGVLTHHLTNVGTWG